MLTDKQYFPAASQAPRGLTSSVVSGTMQCISMKTVIYTVLQKYAHMHTQSPMY